MNHTRAASTVLAAAVLSLAAALLAVYPATVATAQAPHKATLIVQFGPGDYVERSIPFSEDSISGLDLLTRSGLQVSAWGSAVCRLEAYGCAYPVEHCFCKCESAPCSYWSYWYWQEGRWVYAQVGAAARRLRGGDSDGWAWGNGQPPDAIPTGGAPAGETAGTTITAIPQRPSQGSQQPASAPAHTDLPVTLLKQYLAFAIAAASLAGGWWFLRRRARER